MTERWLPVPDYEGLYEVSDQGRVRSLPRATTSGRILKQGYTNMGYLFVSLSNGKRTSRGVHRLMGLAFLPNPDDLPQVRHLDDDKNNNHLSNLAWGTTSHNGLDAVRNGVHPNTRKTGCKYSHGEYTLRKDGRRFCRQCKVKWDAAHYRKKLTLSTP